MEGLVTSILHEVERDLDDQLLWLLLGQPARITIRLLSTSTGAVLHDRASGRVAEISVRRLPHDVDLPSHRAAMADAHAPLKLDGEWLCDDPRGYQLSDRFDRLTVVEFHRTGAGR